MYHGHRDWKAKPDLEVLGRRDKATISNRVTHLITTVPVTWRRVDTLARAARSGYLLP